MGAIPHTTTVLDLGGIAEPDELVPAPTVRTATGTRTQDPVAMRVLLEPWLDAFGITRVGCLTGLDCLGVPVHTAVRPQGRVLSAGAGKGTTTATSWVSAVMEAAELHAWEAEAPSDVLASERALRLLGATVVPTGQLSRRAGTWWGSDHPARWRSGWDIVRAEACFVPDGLVTCDDDPVSPFVSGTNGLASGGTVSEALLSGLLEVVERDGVANAQRGAECPQVHAPDVASVLERCAPEIADSLARAAVRLEVLDVTTDVGIPTYLCFLDDAPGERIGAFFGAGAALADEVALLRAVVEAAQSRTVIVAGARDDLFTARRRSAVRLASARPARSGVGFVETATEPGMSIERQLDVVTSRLQHVGCDRVVAFRHAAAGPVKVVRVVVPGLEGHASASHRALPRPTRSVR